MRAKLYKIRGLTTRAGENTFVDLDLEFEGDRAFVVWDAISLGKLEFKARLELNPKLIRRVEDDAFDYFYNGSLDLPRPQDN